MEDEGRKIDELVPRLLTQTRWMNCTPDILLMILSQSPEGVLTETAIFANLMAQQEVIFSGLTQADVTAAVAWLRTLELLTTNNSLTSLGTSVAEKLKNLNYY